MFLTVVEGNPKVPFSVVTISKCRVGHYSFDWIDQLTLDLYHIIMCVK